MFERLLKLRNDVGLLLEEYDPVGKRMVGNFHRPCCILRSFIRRLRCRDCGARSR
jgi:hypothetical protein